jgi:hypothetical protein
MPANSLKTNPNLVPFQPGYDPRRQAGPGRPPGKKNKRGMRMRDAIIQAASRVGDENGEGGYVGWRMKICRAYPLEFFQTAASLSSLELAWSSDPLRPWSTVSRPLRCVLRSSSRSSRSSGARSGIVMASRVNNGSASRWSWLLDLSLSL